MENKIDYLPLLLVALLSANEFRCRAFNRKNCFGEIYEKGDKNANKILNISSMLIVLLIMAVFLSSEVMALGITPGRTNLDYRPGGVSEVEFSVVNSDNKDINLIVLVQGELNASVAVSEVSFKMSASEGEKKLKYTLKMPSELKPGLHTADVVVIQLPGKSEVSDAFIGAALGVATQIHVYVPYPGKYAEAELDVIPQNENGEILFVIPVHSRGDLDLVRVRATIDIYGALNEKITTINTNEVGILSSERKEIAARWKPDVNPGTYRAVATVLYDEEVLTLEKQFNVGEALLELEQVEVNNFQLGEIAKFEMLVNNKWGEPIKDAYAQMIVYNNEGGIMADFKSASYDIPALTKELMVLFWDTGGVREGNYDSSVFLKYGEQSVQRDLKLEVFEDKINIIGVGYVISSAGRGGSGSTLTIALVVGIVVLILINVTWFLVLRKRLKGKNK